MSDKKSNNEIHPQLEAMLKEELANRAEKLQKMNAWKAEESTSNNKAKIIALPAAITSAAAIIIAGFFFFNTPNNNIGMPEETEPVVRGALDTSIYDAIDAGNTELAIHLIDSCQQECNSQLQRLHAIDIPEDRKQEVADRTQDLQHELHELDSLKTTLQK